MKSTKQKTRRPTANHAGQLLWTIGVAVAVGLILLRQQTLSVRGASHAGLMPEPTSAFQHPATLEPQRTLAESPSMR